MNAGQPPLGGFEQNLAQMMQQAQEQARKMREESDRKLAEATCEGSAGGGMVRVTMNGLMEIKSLKIEPDVVESKDMEMLEDLVAAALNAALKKAEALKGQLGEQQLGNLTQGLGGMPGLGGVDLSKIFGG